ncbi:MAG: phosphate ABC transporter permease subunit PstC, partial [Verrucomicrobiota bacterium]
KSGMEFVGYAKDQVDRHQILERVFQQLEADLEEPMTLQQERNFNEFEASFKSLIEPQQEMVDQWVEMTSAVRNTALDNSNLEGAIQLFESKGDTEYVAQLKKEIKPVEYDSVYNRLRTDLPRYEKETKAVSAGLDRLLAKPLSLPEEMRPGFEKAVKKARDYQADLGQVSAQMKAWDPDKPVAFYRSFVSFILGSQWVTNSFWQDFYGIIPLFSGSLLISVLALSVAVPLSLAAAIYANQIAKPFELNFVKPYIEFINAFPSIVLGFFGIVVLGNFILNISTNPMLSWIPGFPMSERLNITTAGLLLALMAIPTIFTLVEDALNNVPRHYVEASYALGATRWQTILKIMIPAALSGIIAAILLGLGRVIGETMVVLLCAGNRIAIPDFTSGIGVFFQPAHTMTGIIAQEMGEVPSGSVHYRALFMVGIVLFTISLGLNFLAQLVVRKFRIAE